MSAIQEVRMSIWPTVDPVCSRGSATSVIATVINARPRDLGGFTVGRVLPSSARRLVGPFMLEFFADDGHWTRGSYDDGNGGHCLVGALLHLSRKHRLPMAPAIALLHDAMPRPGLPLVHFNDSCCGSVAELRSVILKARRLAEGDTWSEGAARAVKTTLLA